MASPTPPPSPPSPPSGPSRPLHYFDLSSEVSWPSGNKNSDEQTHRRRRHRPSRSLPQISSSSNVQSSSDPTPRQSMTTPLREEFSKLGSGSSSQGSSPVGVALNLGGFDSVLNKPTKLSSTESGSSARGSNILRFKLPTSSSSLRKPSPLSCVKVSDDQKSKPGASSISRIESASSVWETGLVTGNVDKGSNVENQNVDTEMVNSTLQKVVEKLEKDISVSVSQAQEESPTEVKREEEVQEKLKEPKKKKPQQKKKKEKEIIKLDSATKDDRHKVGISIEESDGSSRPRKPNEAGKVDDNENAGKGKQVCGDKQPTDEDEAKKESKKKKNEAEKKNKNKEKIQQDKNDTAIKPPKFSWELTPQEIAEDLYAMTGRRPSRRVDRRPRSVQRDLDRLIPGQGLEFVSADSYKVNENTGKGK